jgi:hypothetical protein
MVVATSLHEQLDEKVAKLRQVSDQLRNGEFLREAMTRAQDPKTWTGNIQVAFSGWLDHVNGWMRIQLSGGIGAVADKLAAYSAQLLSGESQYKATGVPPAPLPPPTRVGTVPGRPPDFILQLGSGMSAMDPAPMKDLVKALGRAKDQLFEASQRVADALTPPVTPPPMVAPGAPPAPPAHHIPDDAADAAGSPGAFQALSGCLEAAIFDVLDRARKLDGSADPRPAGPIDVSGLAASGAAAVDSASTAQQQASDAAIPPPAEVPPAPPPVQGTSVEQTGTQQQIDDAKRDANTLADQYRPPEEVLDHPERVRSLAAELNEHHGHPGDSAFAAEFVRRFGPKNVIGVTRTLQAYQNGYRKGMPFDPRSHMRGLDDIEPDKRPSEKDVQGLLYSFSATVATASPSLDAKTTDEIVKTDDPEALSWLMSNPDAKFSQDFLVKAFDRVEQQIVRDAQDANNPMGPRPPGPGLAGLGPDAKVGILGAISRNPDAAAEIVLREDFKKKLMVLRGAQPPLEAKNVVEVLFQGGYGDKGVAVGQMLDSAHKRLVDAGDTGHAQFLVDRITQGATDKKEINECHAYLRNIGQRQPVSETDSQIALDRLKDEPNTPGRELLVGMTRASGAATQLVGDAAAGKKYAEELLHETQSAWDLVNEGLKNPATSKSAEDALERTIKYVGDGKHLSNEARRGLALALPSRMDEIAVQIASQSGGSAATDVGFQSSLKSLQATLKELARDDAALGTFVSGIGARASQAYAQTAGAFDEKLRSGEDWQTAAMDLNAAYAGGGKRLGTMFCEVTKALHQEGLDRVARAQTILSRYQFGVNLAFEVVPGLRDMGSIAFKGHELPGTISGKVTDELKDKVAGAIAGVDPSEVACDAKAKEAKLRLQLDHMISENMMTAMAGRDGLLSQGKMELPGWMMKERPAFFDDPTATWPQDYPSAYLKPEFVDRAGKARFPVVGDKDHEAFEKWCISPPEKTLFNASQAATVTLRQDMDHCLLQALE